MKHWFLSRAPYPSAAKLLVGFGGLEACGQKTNPDKCFKASGVRWLRWHY